MAEKTEKKLGFQTEVNQLLHLVTHALYSNKEIFLRELISNASDACDKLRFEAIADSKLYENDSELMIHIEMDKDKGIISVRDNGIGMNEQEVIENLGTIARSGTREFLQNLPKDNAKDNQLIGQFGVGFYSGFIVADKIIVRSRRAGEAANQGVEWVSEGKSDFTIRPIKMSQRGTEITLHLKKEEKEEFLDEWRLKSIIRKYSDHIAFPVKMLEQKTDEENNIEFEWQTINRATALWAQPKKDITKEEYKEFYKHIAHDFNEPLLWNHTKVEGKLEYISLLYIPSSPPFDLFNRDNPRGLKLFVKRVFIMDNAEELLPLYLRFVKGVIDSNDLPLNVSRELLQNNKVVQSIRNAVAKRVLGLLEKLATDKPEKYQEFWRNFGAVLKEGIAEDSANKNTLAKLLRFASTHQDSEEQNVTLDDYVARMREGQDKIYYITAETYNAAKSSPHLEIFKEKGVEVLLLSDRIDEWLVAHLNEYEGKTLQSVAKGSVDIDQLNSEDKEAEQEKTEQFETDFADVVAKFKEVLGEKVKDVRVTNRLTSSPACVVADENDLGIHVQRMLKEAGQAVPQSKPILEINPKHQILIRIRDELNTVDVNLWSHLLLEQALLVENGQLDDPASFVSRINQLIAH